MKISEIATSSFRRLGRELGYEVEMFNGQLVVYAPMWRRALSAESQFCKALLANGYLTDRQLQRAVWQYRLGATKTGRVIFWQINEHDEICEGKVMSYLPDCHRDKRHNPTWVGHLLSLRYGWGRLPSRHCFFGLHLLGRTPLSPPVGGGWLPSVYPPPTGSVHKNSSPPTGGDRGGLSPIAIVEAEKTAVILSARYPQYIWLAAGGLGEVQPDKFRPLRGRHIIMFPDTDPDGIAFKRWSDAANLVMQQLFWEDSPPIRVSPILEQQATSEQKQRKIDLVDFLF